MTGVPSVRDAPSSRRPISGYLSEGSLALKCPPEPDIESPPSRPPLADATRSAIIVARAILEVLSGWRPAGQLTRWTSHALQQDLEHRAPRSPSGGRLRLVKVRVSEPSSGIAEVCAIAHDLSQARVRVIALRLERFERGWVVTRLEAG